MEDLTQYSNAELSLHVFNDESLYNIRHRAFLKATLEELFLFTPEQWEELEADLEADNDE